MPHLFSRAAIFLGIITAAHFSPAAPVFAPAVSLQVASTPTCAAASDLDHDGDVDLVTTHFLPCTASVLLNNGSGTFHLATSYPTAGGPFWIAIGRLNADIHPDLVVANQNDHALSVLLGNGDGTFAPRVDIPTRTYPSFVAIADVNNDGRADLCAASYIPFPGAVSIHLGNGDGSFSARTEFGQGDHSEPWALALGDLNNDSHVDLAIANYFHDRVGVRLGVGDGTFGTMSQYIVPSVVTSVSIADLDRDGASDIVAAANYSDRVAVLVGNGNGTFAPPVLYATGSYPNEVKVSDLDLDGHLDLIVANSSSQNVSVLTGNGDGIFNSQITFPVGLVPYSVVAADLNGDGRPDLATANYQANTVSVLRNITPSPPLEPFEIVAATTDTTLYQNGVDTVHMNFITRSNWGSSDNLHLSVDLEPNFGERIHVGEDHFALLTPGAQHVTQLSWQVPDSSYTWEMAGDVELTDLAASVQVSSIVSTSYRRRLPGWFQTNPIPFPFLHTVTVQASNCLNEEEECFVRHIALFPVIGSVASLQLMKSDFCKAALYMNAGDQGRAEAALRAGRTKLGKNLFLDGLSLITRWTPVHAAVERVKLFHSGGELARNCSNWRLGNWLRSSSWVPKPSITDSQGSAAVDSIATWMQVGIDSTDTPVADILIVAGDVDARIEAAGSYAVSDSTGLIYGSVDNIDSLASIAVTTVGVHELHGNEEDNPASAAVFRARSRKTQTLTVGLVHRNVDGSRRYLRYPNFPIASGGRLWIALANNLQRFPLWVDEDGNSSTPAHVLHAIPTDVEERVVNPGVTALDAIFPNPTEHAVHIRFTVAASAQASVRVYDVAGRLVATVLDQYVERGSREVTWSGRSSTRAKVANGLYFIRLTTAEKTVSRRVLLLR